MGLSKLSVLRVGIGIDHLTPGAGTGSASPNRIMGTNLSTVKLFERYFGIAPVVTLPTFKFADAGVATAGVGFTFTVTQVLANGATNTAYTGTVHFTSSDTQAVLPGNAALVSGVGVFSATLSTFPNQVLKATDVSASTLTGQSAGINVQIATPTISIAAVATVGTAVVFTVTAQYPDAAVYTAYAGTVAFTSSDTAAIFPAATTLTSGVGTFSATFRTAGTQSVNASDGTSTSFASGIVVWATNALYVLNKSSGTFGVLLGNGDGTFRGATTYAFGGISEGLAAADLTGNGTIDVAVASGGNKFLGVFLGAGNGTFGGLASYAAGNAPEWVVVGDFNGDGFPDLATPNLTDKTLGVFTNNGNGTFGAMQTFAGVLDIVSLVAADLNGDAILDLIGTSNISSNYNIAVWLGNGDGTFQAPTTYSCTDAPAGVAVTDLNGDGIKDLMVMAYDAGGFVTLLGNGNGTFQAAVSVSGPSMWTPVLADVNGDMIPDLVSTSGTLDKVNVCLGNGNGTFQAAQTFATAGKPFGLAVVDFNGDGHLDLAVSNLNAVTVSVLLGNGNGTFQVQHTFASGGNAAFTLAATPPVIFHGNATKLIVTSGVSVSAGNALAFTVTAQDPYGATATGYAGSVYFGSTDSAANLPGMHTLTSGVGTFSVTLNTVGTQTVRVMDWINNSIAGKSAAVTVAASGGGGVATHLVVSTPANTTVGSPFVFTVTAETASNTVATSYAGSVTFSTSDPSGVIPTGSQTLTSGVGDFSATFETSGNQTITVTDVTDGFTATSSNISVVSGLATHFVLTAASNSTAGHAVVFTVTAEDQFNNVVTTYPGTVQFTSSDANTNVVLPPSATLASGVGVFSATLITAASETITATDSVTATITGASNAVTVAAGPNHQIAWTVATTATAGVNIAFVTTMQDTYGNTSSSSDTMQINQADPSGIYPSGRQWNLTAGVANESMTLLTAGSQAYTVSDHSNSTIVAATASINVAAAPANHFVLTAPANFTSGTGFKFTVTADDTYNNPDAPYAGTMTFTSSDTNAIFPASGTLSGGTGSFSCTLFAPLSQAISATDTVSGSITGTVTLANYFTYYVDNSGHDTATGFNGSPWQTLTHASTAAAWAPGVSLLLTGGQTFTGNLAITISGNTKSLIFVGVNGTSPNYVPAANPATINAVDATNGGLQFVNCGYIWAESLIAAGSGVNPSNGSSTGAYQAVLAYSTSSTGNPYNSITYSNCTATGALQGFFAAVNPGCDKLNLVTYYQCRGWGNQHIGIQTGFAGSNTTLGNVAVTNLAVINCKADNNYGALSGAAAYPGAAFGIAIQSTNGGTVTGCVADLTGAAGSGYAGSNGSTGIILTACNNVTISQSEACRTYATNGIDGEGFDFEECSNCTLTRSDAHDNQGPGLYVFGGDTGITWSWNNVYRNCSVTGSGDLSNNSSNGTNTVTMFHNTVWATNAPAAGLTAEDTCYNNIFQCTKGSTAVLTGSPAALVGNVYSGNGTTTVAGQTSISALRTAGYEKIGGTNYGAFGNPVLYAPGGGSAIAGPTLPAFPVADLGIGFAPMSTSPAVQEGANLESSFSINPGPVDFAGNPSTITAQAPNAGCMNISLNAASYIQFDNAADLGNNGGSGTLTVSYTVGSGSNRLLIVVITGGSSTDNITGVTYGGVAMTLVAKKAPGARWVYVYYLLNPASGANNVVITASSDYIIAVAASYSGAQQSSQPDNFATATSAGNIGSWPVSIIPSAASCWAILASESVAGTPSAGAGTVLRAYDHTFTQPSILDSGGPLIPGLAEILTVDYASTTGAANTGIIASWVR